MRGQGIAAAIALTLAGCSGEPSARNTSAPATPDPVEAQINNLSEPLKDVAFFRAVRDAGYACQKIVHRESRPRNEGRAAWAVKCENNADYGIVLQPGGTFLVTGAVTPRR